MSDAFPSLVCLLAFDGSNRMAVRKLGSKTGLAFTGIDLAMALERLESAFPSNTKPVEYFKVTAGGRAYSVYFAQAIGTPLDSEIEPWSIENLTLNSERLAPSLKAIIEQLDPYLIEIPYLHIG